MPRQKRATPSDEVKALEQAQKDLAAKLKAAKAKARAEEHEKEERRALIAGRLAVRELVDNASGTLAAALRDVMAMKLKPAERALFDTPEKGNA